MKISFGSSLKGTVLSAWNLQGSVCLKDEVDQLIPTQPLVMGPNPVLIPLIF